MPVEIDFLGLEKQKEQQQYQPLPSSNRKRLSSIRDIQKVASMLSPDMLRSVLAGNCSNPITHSPSVQTRANHKISPLTIIYNGTVSVFEATPDLAENVMKMAAERKIQLLEIKQQHLQQQREILMKEFKVHGDMPLLRKKSLQRFFEKRRERLVYVAPYPASSSSSVGDIQEYVNQNPNDINVKVKKQKNSLSSSSSSSTFSSSNATTGHGLVGYTEYLLDVVVFDLPNGKRQKSWTHRRRVMDADDEVDADDGVAPLSY